MAGWGVKERSFFMFMNETLDRACVLLSNLDFHYFGGDENYIQMRREYDNHEIMVVVYKDGTLKVLVDRIEDDGYVLVKIHQKRKLN
jgi:hypothetical protein